MKLLRVSWQEIEEIIEKLALKIRKDGFQPDLILGIARGGLVPARILSDIFAKPLNTLGVTYYIGIKKTEQEPKITQEPGAKLKEKLILIADDVADKGTTLKYCKRFLLSKEPSKLKLATLFYKPWSSIEPDYWVKQTKKWVVFPWEWRETIRELKPEERKMSFSSKEIESVL